MSGGRRTLLGSTLQLLKERLTPASFDPLQPKLLWRFDTSEAVKQWFCSTDEAIGGKSTASFALNDRETRGKFAGTLSTEVPNDGKVVRSGYCMLRSRLLQPTLFGNSYFDISDYNGLELKLRGDGRTYILNVQTASMQEDDIYQAFVYTKGGQLTQTVQIPFSEFLLTNMGYVQNEQTLMQPRRVSTFGILLADRIDGDFSLELESLSAVILKKEISNMDADAT